MNPVKILIVDNHPAIRHGLLEVIGDEKDIVVCGEAGDRQDTLEAIHHDTLDFVILDVSLKDPSRTGFDFIPDIHSHLGPIPILVCPEKPLLLFFHRGTLVRRTILFKKIFLRCYLAILRCFSIANRQSQIR